MDKYKVYRRQIKTGDIILYRGKSLLSYIIQTADKAYYNHAGVAYWIGDRLFTIDAWSNGTELVPISRRMDAYVDFCVVRKTVADPTVLRGAMEKLLNRVERDEAYGVWGLIKRLLYIRCRKVFEFLFKIKALTREKVDKHKNPVCSDVAREFAEDYGVKCYNNVVLPSPQDLFRYANPIELTILFDNSLSKK